MNAEVEPEKGVRLDQWLDQQPRTWREIADIFFDVAQALSLAHAAGTVYQEIRVEQIVVGPDGRGSLFNLKPATGDPPNLAAPVLRTAAIPLEERLANLDSIEAASYLAPEQFRGGGSTPISNQFSTCVALYRALYRQVPFDHDWAVREGGSRSTRTPLGSVRFDLFVKSFDRTTMVNLVREVLSGNLRQPPYDSDVPGWLEQIVRRGLQADPDERFPSMAELLHELATNLGATAKARLVKPRRRLGLWAVVGGVGLLVLAATLIAVLGGTR